MPSILLIITCQLLLAVTDASDKRLKGRPKSEQAIEVESENTTETEVVFAPPVSDYRLIVANDESAPCETSRAATGFYSEPPRCRGEGSSTELSARGYNYTGEPITFVSQPVSTGTSAENTNVDISDSVTEDVGLSQLDQSVADVPISELKASVYKKLGAVLESPNTRDGTDPWWNYLILNHNDLEVNRRQQRYIEKSQQPGLEFLDILDESGYTMQDLENLFMRFQIHEALDLLRSHQFDVIGRRNYHHTVSEREDEGNKKPTENFLNDVSGESETDNEMGDSNQNVRKGNDALNDKKDVTSVDSTDDATDTSAHTPDVGHCDPNPCKHEGKCITDEDGYTCKCSYKWYSGKNCEIDRGPCINACFKSGTSSCYYSGPDGENTVCNCKIGYDGDQCETGHDYAKYPLVRNVIDSCNERGLSESECIADTLGVDTDVNSIEGLFKVIDEGGVKLTDILGNVVSKVFLQSRKQNLFGNGDVGKVVDKLPFQGGKQKLFGDGKVGKVVDKWKNVFN